MAFLRETAYRVFSQEFNASRATIEAQAEKEASYVVSPLGAKMNRVHIVGVCTDVEAAGESGDQYKMRLSDPSGQFFINAGQYQPEAAQAMSELQPPCFVAVTGKARAWTGDDGQIRVNIRPETVAVVDEATRDQWVLTTAKQTMQRLDAIDRVKADPNVTKDAMVAAGVRDSVAEGAFLAQEHYGMLDVNGHTEVVKGALKGLLPGGSFETHDVAPSSPAATEVPAWTPQAAPAAPAVDDAADAFDDAVLAIVSKLAGDDGARWDDILAEAKGDIEDVTDEGIEEALNRLMDKGLVYEPTLGVLRTT